MTILIGRKDWEVVSFADYEEDTRELAERSAYAIRELRRERDQAVRMMWAVVQAAGGNVRIPEGALQEELPPHEIERFEYDRTLGLRTRR